MSVIAGMADQQRIKELEDQVERLQKELKEKVEEEGKAGEERGMAMFRYATFLIERAQFRLLLKTPCRFASNTAH